MRETTVDHWDLRFFELARLVASWSKDPSTQTGAVIVDRERRVVAMGFNGFPRRVRDLPERYENRELKYKMVVHCEANAILNATASVNGYMMYTTKMPCTECTKLIIQAGISSVFVDYQDPEDPGVKRWAEDAAISMQMFTETGTWIGMAPIRPNLFKQVVPLSKVHYCGDIKCLGECND